MLVILETVEPGAEIVAACTEATKRGFRLAMDDAGEAVAGSPLLELASYVKIDFQTSSPASRQEAIGACQRAGGSSRQGAR